MLIPIILFLISLIGLSVLFYKKIEKIRLGFEHTAQEHPHFDWHEMSVRNLREYAINNAKELGHQAVLGGLKTWIKLNYTIKRKYAEHEPKIKSILGIKDKIATPGSPVSNMLSAVADYKKKIKKVAQKMKAEEEKNNPVTPVEWE